MKEYKLVLKPGPYNWRGPDGFRLCSDRTEELFPATRGAGRVRAVLSRQRRRGALQLKLMGLVGHHYAVLVRRPRWCWRASWRRINVFEEVYQWLAARMVPTDAVY